MPEDKTNFRMKRIEKLLHELRYEVERGIMENEIEEEIGFRFLCPLSLRMWIIHRRMPNILMELLFALVVMDTDK